MKKQLGNDPRHLFVQRIPLDATMSDMFKTFEQFGEITRICFVAKQNNPHTGSAFVDYATEESGQAVLEKSNSKIESILVKDQNVLVIMAASRDEILEKMKPKDKRNIHLMYEGHITPDMEAAEGVPEAEMAKRKKLWERKQAKLADDNNKISPTRLAIFNAPPSASTLQIRKIFAVAPKKYARTHKNEELSKLIKQSSPKITDIRKVEGQEGVFFWSLQSMNTLLEHFVWLITIHHISLEGD